MFTGSDSPVKAASLTASCFASPRRISAGIRSPASITTKSPGTSSPAGTFLRTPSLMTTAVGALNSFNASRDFSALYSWIKPKTALITTMHIITKASLYSPSTADKRMAPNNTKTIKSRNCMRNSSRSEIFFFPCKTLRPFSCNLCSASRTDSPAAGPSATVYRYLHSLPASTDSCSFDHLAACFLFVAMYMAWTKSTKRA